VPPKGLYVLSPFDPLTLAQGGPGVSTPGNDPNRTAP
jgi:hypothetical protein